MSTKLTNILLIFIFFISVFHNGNNLLSYTSNQPVVNSLKTGNTVNDSNMNTDKQSVLTGVNENVLSIIKKAAATTSQWTILVYMDGDNNLEPAVIDDINEMESVSGLSNVNIVIQVDRINGYDSSNGDWTGARRYKIVHDTNPNTISSTLLSNLGEVNMGDPSVLKSFMEWGLTNYPANHYALVLWDHGGGVEGVAWDDTNNNDHLTVDELSSTFEQVANDFGNQVSFDIIGFDACLMSTVEVVSQIKDYAKYIVASEEVEPGDGWPYDRILNMLSKSPSMDGQQLATIIVNEYGNDYESRGAYDTTLSAIKTDKVQNLMNIIDSFSSQLKTQLTSEINANTNFPKTRSIENAINNAQKYQLDNQIDFGGFVKLLKDSNNFDNILLTSLLGNYTNTILKTYYGSLRGGSTGLTVHVNPYDYPAGLKIVKNTNWDEFLQTFFNALNKANNAGYSSSSTSSGPDLQGNFTAIYPTYPTVGTSSKVEFVVLNIGTTTSQGYNVSFYEYTEGDKESAVFVGSVSYSALDSNYMRVDNFTWTPTKPGWRSLLLFVESSGESNEGNNLDSFKTWIKPSTGSPASYIWLNETDECFVEGGGYGCTGKIYYEVDNYGSSTIPANTMNVTIVAESVEFGSIDTVTSYLYASNLGSFYYFANSVPYTPTHGGNYNFYILVDYPSDPVKEDDWNTVSTYVYSLQTDLGVDITNADSAFEGYSSLVNIDVYNLGLTNPGSNSAVYLFDYIYYNDTLSSNPADAYLLNGFVTNILDTSNWFKTSYFTWTPDIGGLHILIAYIVEDYNNPSTDNDPFDYNDFSYFVIYVSPNAPDLSVEQFSVDDANSYVTGTTYGLNFEIWNIGQQDANGYDLNVYDYNVDLDQETLAVADTLSLASFDYSDLVSTWTPTTAGDHILIIEVTHPDDYINVTNYAYVTVHVIGNNILSSSNTQTNNFSQSTTDTTDAPGFEVISLFAVFMVYIYRKRFYFRKKL